MNTSAFVEIEFWALVVSSLVIPAAIYAGMVTKRKISRVTVFAFGMLLIVLSGLDLLLLRHLVAAAGASISLIDDVVFKSEYSAALYILPLLSGAVGTNLISHVLVQHLEEAEKRHERDRQAAHRRSGA
jgi:hypothetical protein